MRIFFVAFCVLNCELHRHNALRSIFELEFEKIVRASRIHRNLQLWPVWNEKSRIVCVGWVGVWKARWSKIVARQSVLDVNKFVGQEIMRKPTGYVSGGYGDMGNGRPARRHWGPASIHYKSSVESTKSTRRVVFVRFKCTIGLVDLMNNFLAVWAERDRCHPDCALLDARRI